MGLATTTVKYILFIFNLLCMLGGIAIIALGSIVLINAKSYWNFETYSIPIAVIILGCIISIIAFFGCCGAIRDSYCMMITYSVFLFVLLAFQIAVVILVFLSKDADAEVIEKGIQKIFDKAQNDPESMNLIQSGFQCCGVNSSTDYGTRQIPPSCCPEQECNNNNYFQRGCKKVVEKNFKKVMNILGAVSIIIFGVELVGFIFACWLALHIRKSRRRSI